MGNLDEPNVVDVVDIVREDQVRPQGIVMGFVTTKGYLCRTTC